MSINYQSLDIKDLEGEVWKDIPEYLGLYMVSNYGRIKGLKNFASKNKNNEYVRIIKPHMDKQSGFLRFKAIKDRRCKSIILHSLVAKIFIPNPDNFIFVLHKNDNRLDNRVENLEWRGKTKEYFNTVDGEIWKDIDGYEDLYKISNYGRVYSVPRGDPNNQKRGSYQTGRILSQRINNGYKSLKLIKNGNEKMALIHRLVAKAFIPNLSNKPIVHHKDFNRSNNHVDNLEWATQKENTDYSCKVGSKNVVYKKDIFFTVGDIMNIKKMIREKNFSYYKVARLYKATPEIIRHINI